MVAPRWRRFPGGAVAARPTPMPMVTTMIAASTTARRVKARGLRFLELRQRVSTMGPPQKAERHEGHHLDEDDGAVLRGEERVDVAEPDQRVDGAAHPDADERPERDRAEATRGQWQETTVGACVPDEREQPTDPERRRRRRGRRVRRWRGRGSPAEAACPVTAGGSVARWRGAGRPRRRAVGRPRGPRHRRTRPRRRRPARPTPAGTDSTKLSSFVGSSESASVVANVSA